MTTFHFQTQVPSDGMITIPEIPALPEKFHGANVTVKVDVYVEPTDAELAEGARRFAEKWKGALKGARDMTMKEIRAERLESKYGQ